MFTQYFGNYLFEANRISTEQFKEALRQIKDKRAKLGVLAIQAGYMTPAQVEETISVQMQADKKFGEIAIQKGYITQEKLDKLLTKQGSPFAVFGQIMIDNKYMTYAQLSEQLADYQKKCGMSDESFSKFQEDDMTPMVDRALKGYAGEPQRKALVKAYAELFIKNITRFISDNVTIGPAGKTQEIEGDWIACQEMYGTMKLISSFSGNEEAMRFIAGKFAKADYAELDLLARDVLGEFLNCNNGIFIANALEYGVDLDLNPQYITKDCLSAQTGDMFSIHLSIEGYRYQLNLAF